MHSWCQLYGIDRLLFILLAHSFFPQATSKVPWWYDTVASALAAVSSDVCLWSGEADLQLLHMVGAHCSQPPLWESGSHVCVRGVGIIEGRSEGEERTWRRGVGEAEKVWEKRVQLSHKHVIVLCRIKDYPIAHFNLIALIEALYLRTAIKGVG